MGGSDGNQLKYDRWVVRDGEGLLHAALVCRKFDAAGMLEVFQVSTACEPKVRQFDNTHHLDWGGTRLPSVQVGSFWVMDWRVREDPTCLACLVHARPDE